MRIRARLIKPVATSELAYCVECQWTEHALRPQRSVDNNHRLFATSATTLFFYRILNTYTSPT